MKNKTEVNNAIPSSCVVITTLVNALLVAICLELDNASGEEKDIGVNDSAANSDNKTSVQELGDSHCKSPGPRAAEICIQMCA